MSAAVESEAAIARTPEVAKRDAQREQNLRALMPLFGGGGSHTGASGRKRTLREWWPQTRSADQDDVADLPALRARSRDLDRNAPIAGGAVETVCQSVVGDELRLSARINRVALDLSDDEADEWETKAEQIYRIASRQLDVTGQQTLGEMEDLALRSQLVSGDVLVIRRFVERPGELLGLKIQFIEADRVSTPPERSADRSVVDGVERDADGVPMAYFVRNRHPDDRSMGEGDRWSRVLTRRNLGGELQSFLLFSRRRPGQTRGLPYLAPVIEPLKQLERYTESELTAAVVASLFTVFVKSPGGGGLAEQTTTAVGDGTEQGKDKDIELAAGGIYDLMPGEEIDTANPGRPNSGFDPFVVAILMQIGSRLGLPYEVLAKKFTASYSASRAALLEAWRFFRRRRSWFATGFCDVIYEWVITEAIFRGLLDAPGFFDDPVARRAWLGAVWTGPAQGSIDPKKEVEGYERLAANHWAADSDITQEVRGQDFDETVQRIARDRATRVRANLVEPPRIASPPDPNDQNGSDLEE